MKYLIVSIFLVVVFFSEIRSYVLIDLEPAASQVQAEFKKGGGKEYEDARHSAEGEKGSKGYVERHEEESGKKGYHDREGEKKNYAEAGNFLNSCVVNIFFENIFVLLGIFCL